ERAKRCSPRAMPVPRHVNIAACIHRYPVAVVKAAATKKTVPSQITTRIEFCGKGIGVTAESADRRTPRGITVARHVNIAAPIHGHAVAVVSATPTKKSVPGKIAVCIQFCRKGISIAAEGADRRLQCRRAL